MLTLATLSLSFLCCRDLDSIPAVYVGMNSLRANVVTTAAYCAGVFYTVCNIIKGFLIIIITFLIIYFIVFGELSSKLDKKLEKFLFLSISCWIISNILTSYTIYFDISILGSLGTIFQVSLTFVFIYCFIHWMKMIARKQNVWFIRFDQLTTDEYAALSYLVPILMSCIANFGYSLSSGEVSWQSRSQTGLVYHIAVIYSAHMTLIRKYTSSLPFF